MRKKLICIFLGLLPLFASAATFPSMESGKYHIGCEAEWTKKGVLHQDMFNYCMDNKKEGYAEALRIIKKFQNQPWIQEVIDYAVKSWVKKGTRDDQMVAYSLQQEIDGFEELVLASKKPNFNKNLYNACYSQWGVQFSMVWYCYDKDQ